jgi:nicotinamidase-related amidase
MMDNFRIDPSSALVLIDLQKGIVQRPLAPRSGLDVVKNAARLAEAFRSQNALVVLVHVEYRDPKEKLNLTVDTPPPSGTLPADWSDIVPELGPKPGDIVVTKRQWGAFYGTDLELQLRRRGIKTLALGGIATNMGVESTARNANERGFEQVFVEDAMASFSASAHQFAVETIFPRLGRVRSTEDILSSR